MFVLKRAREQAGKSRQDVVDHLDCASSHVSHLETGRNLPSAAECEKLLVFYGLGDRWPFFRELLKAAKKGRDCGRRPRSPVPSRSGSTCTSVWRHGREWSRPTTPS